MTIYKETRRGRSSFVLDLKIAGRRKRSYHSTRKKAEKAASDLQREKKKHGDMFARYSEAARIEWMMAHELAKEGGFSLLDAVKNYSDTFKEENDSCITVGKAVRDFLREKKATIKERSMRALSSTMERFGEPRWNDPLASVARADVMAFLSEGKGRDGKAWSTRTKNGYLTDLKNFFNWCCFEGHLQESPAGRVRKFRASDEELADKEDAKHILTVDEVSQIMSYLRGKCPDMVARAALLFFAGLRPDREAATITWDEILFDEELVWVRGSRAKDRQNRYIKMSRNLNQWLRWGMDNGSELPVTNWDKRWYKMKGDLGLKGEEWPHDATRHSFASYNLASAGEDETVKALGHGTYDMLFQHYRTLVKEAEAEKYFSICP